MFQLSSLANMEITVKVYAPAFIDHSQIAEDGSVRLPEGATLNNLFKQLKLPLPLRFSSLFRVNYERADWNTRLQNGDIITFIFPVNGG